MICSHVTKRMTAPGFFFLLEPSASFVAKPSIVDVALAAARTHMTRRASLRHDSVGSRGSAMAYSSVVVVFAALGRGSSICRFARSSNESAIAAAAGIAGQRGLACGRGVSCQAFEPFGVGNGQVDVRTFSRKGDLLASKRDHAIAVVEDAT